MAICECGCGKTTSIVTMTNRRQGHIKGESMRFIRGHSGKLKRRVYLDRSSWTVDATTGCWIWRHGLTVEGYGQLRLNGKTRIAHRAVYEDFRGPIPSGLDLDHTCRNRRCVNPEHLEPVSRAENCRRGMIAKLTRNVVDEMRLNLRFFNSRYAAARYYAPQLGVHPRTVQSAFSNGAWR